MLGRFCLYGFLKNQRYYEPFLVLALLAKGLDFFAIGLLIALREITVVALELPSGALADASGRRRVMIVSFVAYILGFVTFAALDQVWTLALAMALIGVGDAFRTGTHKAMIFGWLRAQGRAEERTRIYGRTRSWSKIGSAVSVVIGATLVFSTRDYDWTFYLCAIPYVIGIVNFLGYSGEVERTGDPRPGTRVLRSALRATLTRPAVRRLVLESMGSKGVFAAVKDYLQPVLEAVAIAGLSGMAVLALDEGQRIAVLVGAVYFVLHLLSAVASRQSHRVETLAGDADGAARLLWLTSLAAFVVLVAFDVIGMAWGLVISFVLLHVLQDVWRPLLIGRFDAHADPDEGATTLSIESQAQRLATAIVAPALGLAVDAVSTWGVAGQFWPVGVAGACVAVLFAVTPTPRPRAE